MTARAWCFTINNPTDDDEKAVWNLKDIAEYVVFGDEIGEEGTQHWQGYVEFGKLMKMRAVSKLLPRARLATRKGSAQQAAEYCKKDEDYIEWGTISRQGARNDLTQAANLVKDRGLQAVADEMPEIYIKYSNGLRALEAIRNRGRRLWDPDCTVFWGAAGSGKTRRVRDLEPDLFVVQYTNFPFDGYMGEPAILFDDFYGQISHDQMLLFLDRYDIRLNIKGGHTYRNWHRVYITSNKTPADWYPGGLSPALGRRIQNVTEVAGNNIPQHVLP